MIVPTAIRRWYDDHIQPCQVLQGIVRGILQPYCDAGRYRFFDRVKTVESLAEKIESGRYPWFEAVDDLYAATIVIPTLEHDAAVVSHLESKFTRSAVRGRGRTSKSPEVFRFDATRFYGRLAPTSIDRDERVSTLLFEVQVQTAFEHAWVSVTHDLTYKSRNVSWRTHRLAATMKAAVEQLDLLVLGFEQSSRLIEPSTWEDMEARELLLRMLEDLETNARIPEELLPASWSRFADNLYNVCGCEARRRRTRERLAVVKAAVACLSEELVSDSIPRSLSLFQTAVGTLAHHGVIRPKLEGVHLPLTDEAIDAFPSLADLGGAPFSFSRSADATPDANA